MSDDHHLDTKGLMCPLPVLKIRKRLMAMEPGDRLWVEATDPAAQIDVPHFCAEVGHTLVDSAAQNGVYRFTILRGEKI
ncbi:MAG: sulfurtransferase TusA family protein [Alphaproteobacteria bacterium]